MKKREVTRLTATTGLAVAMVATSATPAMAQGLSQMQSTSQSLLDQIQTIGPIIATIIVVLSGVGYAARMIEKDTFVRIAVGCIIAGSASALVPMFWSGS
jgi:type IV secretory pathway VirB2 component (pilin)